MRVFFDATLLGSGTGIERFSRELLGALSQFDLELNVLIGHPNVQLPDGVTAIPISKTPRDDTYRVVWQQTQLPRLLKKQGADIYLSPAPEGMFFPSVKQIISVLDVIPLRYPTIPQNTFFYRWLMPHLIRRCEAVLTISENTRNDIRTFFPNYHGDIQVAYPGYTNGCFFPRPIKEQMSIRKKYNLGQDPFILFLGEARPYKNVIGIMEAFSQAGLPSHRLVVAGRLDAQEELLRKKAQEVSIWPQTLLLGYVPDEELAALYSSCQMFVFASLYEGFGLPPLEAMACGAPIILSNTASLPEVGGEAVLYINPHQVSDICEAMRRLAHNPDLRQELRQKSLAQAARFNYGATAAQVYQLIKQVTSRSY